MVSRVVVVYSCNWDYVWLKRLYRLRHEHLNDIIQSWYCMHGVSFMSLEWCMQFMYNLLWDQLTGGLRTCMICEESTKAMEERRTIDEKSRAPSTCALQFYQFSDPVQFGNPKVTWILLQSSWLSYINSHSSCNLFINSLYVSACLDTAYTCSDDDLEFLGTCSCSAVTVAALASVLLCARSYSIKEHTTLLS